MGGHVRNLQVMLAPQQYANKVQPPRAFSSANDLEPAPVLVFFVPEWRHTTQALEPLAAAFRPESRASASVLAQNHDHAWNPNVYV
jgi:hypothetical protein